MTRILIAGGPRTGKTTLAKTLAQELGIPALHADDAIPLGWSESSAEVARWIALPGPWIIEGVSVPRALRKWLDAHPHARTDEIHCRWLSTPYGALTDGQRAMSKGVQTVWREILPEVYRRGGWKAVP